MKLLKDAEQIELKPKPKNWNFKDLEGQRFGHLYVAGYLGKRLMNSNTFWLVHCDCGNFGRATTQQITSGNLTDCGCLKEFQGNLPQNKKN
jgi:hypothetical protein